MTSDPCLYGQKDCLGGAQCVCALPTADILPTRYGVISYVLGARCEQFEPTCMTCIAWAMSDEIDRLHRELSQARAEYAACIATVDRLENGHER